MKCHEYMPNLTVLCMRVQEKLSEACDVACDGRRADPESEVSDEAFAVVNTLLSDAETMIADMRGGRFNYMDDPESLLRVLAGALGVKPPSSPDSRD